jgi:hypothetical protein
MSPLVVASWLGSRALAASVTLSPGDDVAALTSALGPGDEVVFAGGVYELPGGLNWTGAGTAETPIVIRAADGAIATLRLTDGGHIVRIADSTFVQLSGLVLEGTDDLQAARGYTGLIVENSSDVDVTDVEIRNLGGTGVYLGGDNTRVHLRALDIHDVREGHGVLMGCWNASCWTSDSTLEWSWIHDLQHEGYNAVEVLSGGQGNTVADNVMNGLVGSGVVLASTEFGPANVVERNAIFEVGRDGLRVRGPATVRNNVVVGAGGYGVRVYDDGNNALADVVVSHNTVVDTLDWGVRLDDWAGRTGLVLANNAVVNPTGRAFYVDEGELDDANRVVGNVFTGWVEHLDPLLGGFTPGNGYADLADPLGLDVYPSVTSAYVGAGDVAADSYVPTADYSGYPRDGAAPDVGAYEFFGDTNPAGPIAAGFKAEAPPLEEGSGVGGCGKGGSEASLLAPLLWLAVGRRHRRRSS